MEDPKAKLMKKYNLTDSTLQTKVSDDHINEIAKFVSWEDVGRHLDKIGRPGVEDIQKDGDNEDKRRRLLVDRWEDKNGDDATYDSMVTAMIKAEKIDEATEVCKLLAG